MFQQICYTPWGNTNMHISSVSTMRAAGPCLVLITILQASTEEGFKANYATYVYNGNLILAMSLIVNPSLTFCDVAH